MSIAESPRNDGLNDAELESLLKQLMTICQQMVAEAEPSSQLESVHERYRASAVNLLHYLSLRRHDLRPLQMKLAALGVSSLGRAESNVLSSIDAVLKVMHRLLDIPWTLEDESSIDFAAGQRHLVENTRSLFGPAPRGRDVRIMVTMPSEAATQYSLVHDLLELGMDCMRINCAHDGPDDWQQMIAHLRQAEQALGRTCKVIMDLGGPKLRTGPLEPAPAVLKVRPLRDRFGNVVDAARIWLTSEAQPPSAADAVLPVGAQWLAQLAIGERVRFTDARGARRSLQIADVTAQGCWAELKRTAYFVPGTVLRREQLVGETGERETTIGELPPGESVIALRAGDLLVISRDQVPGRPASFDTSGRLLTPATIGCSMPEVFDDVRPGETIWFDDGKIGGVVEAVAETAVQVRIKQTRIGGGKLRSDKGINLPDSDLKLGALTPQDLEDLTFVAQHADVIDLSFANTAADVELLQAKLQELGHHDGAIVLKIETRRGFQNLPDMLLSAMRWPNCGVMIARGDLAVECGFERMAEVQEEILWICEAAHVPVIWATQVLESLAKQGMPSRAEITDAAMGHRSECVMLNKGPHVRDAVKALDNILRRMQTHQSKKRAMLRELQLAILRRQPPA